MKDKIIKMASEMFDVHPRDLAGDYRFAFLMPARFAIYAALRKRGWSFAAIGRLLERDPKTVAYGVSRAADMMLRDEDYANNVNTLSDNILPQRQWKPTVDDVFNFVCQIGGQDTTHVRKTRFKDTKSGVLANIAIKVCFDIGIPVCKIGKYFGHGRYTIRRVSATFIDLWKEMDNVLELLERTQEEFSNYCSKEADNA